jgi:hypothetical protein
VITIIMLQREEHKIYDKLNIRSKIKDFGMFVFEC